ncbi:pre-peptidase C-terminal domain-containing protein [Sphingomonas sabuli]|uniref:Pre-peptidase C-terminal domain-containing protein n=1 Tax=Sphingomonas sabuli TaxID=2764186 RepID=A0A7G9L5I2_9SPHN|nr:matrixin family metalloprotease [Sphingomonas sabuli]QNM83881.1 pre-peptidase C-terminal domain-containing protein [Sphingomonas sabuli]
MPSTSQPATGRPEIDGILWGLRWSGGTVTYAFPDSASDFPAGYGDEPTTDFFPVSVYQQEVVRYVFGLIESYTNLTFSYTGTNTGDLMFGQTSLAPTAYAYYPGDGNGGDIWFGDDFRNPRMGDYAFLTHLHEIGHALGLSHPHDSDGPIGGVLPLEYDYLNYTVMSYRDHYNGPLSYSLPQFHYPTSFMTLDILALQTMYGADYSTNSGNTVYSWSPTTGQQFINGVGQMTPGSGSGYFGDGASNHIMMTVWDGGGTDTFNFANYGLTASQSLNINIGAGAGIYLPNGTIYNSLLFDDDVRSLIENVIGSVNRDNITGNQADNRLDGRVGDDILSGEAGNDTLIGDEGDDQITGGSGNDRINGGVGDDILSGGSGIDVLDAGTGDNQLRGGFNRDIAMFGFNFIDAMIRFLPDGAIYVGTADGFNIIRSVEVLRFLDGDIEVSALRPDDTTAPTAMLPQDNLVVTGPGQVPQSWQGVTIQFNEDVTLGAGNVRIFYSDGTLYRTYAASDLFTDGDTLFVPYPTGAGQYYIEADPGVVVDMSGNEFEGISGRNALNFLIGVRSDDYPNSFGLDSGALTINGPALGGYISDNNDQDTFRVQLNSGQSYRFWIDASGVNGAGDLDVRIYDAYGSQVSGGDANEGLWITPTYTSTYYVYVTPRIQPVGESGAGDYSVQVVAGNDDMPAGPSTQVGLATGGTVSGVAQGESDIDWIRVELVYGHTYRFTASPSGGDASDYISMHLVRFNDGTLQYNPLPEDGNYTSLDSSSSTAGAQIVYTASATGTYFLRINADTAGTGTQNNGGTYSVTMTEGSYSAPLFLSAASYGGTNAPYSDLVLTFDRPFELASGFITINTGNPIIGNGGLLRIDVTDTSQVRIVGNTIRVNPSIELPAGRLSVQIDQSAVVGTDGTFFEWAAGAINTFVVGYHQYSNFQNYADDYLGTAATLGRVAIGQSATGEYHASGFNSGSFSGADTDWFRVELVAGQTYDFGLLTDTGLNPYISYGSGYLLHLQLVDASGAVIAQDMDNSGGHGNSRILFTATQSGVFFLAVSGETIGGGSTRPRYEVTMNDPQGLTVVGTSAGDVLRGSAGFDRIDGLGGADRMAGGLGGDTYTVDNAGDEIVEGLTGGVDTVLSSITLTLPTNVENIMLIGNGAIDATGSSGDNRLSGNDAANELRGLAGNDVIEGGGGNDRIDGGTGSDVMRGGAGNDIYYVDETADLVVEGSGQGNDAVYSLVSYTLRAGVEDLYLNGTVVRGTGNAEANRLFGNASANILDGGGGVDIMRGGAGDDVYYVDNFDDLVIENAGEGNDVVYSSANFCLRADVEDLTLIGSAVRAYGNAGSNRLIGNNSANILDGGAGADVMRGGAGNDTYYVDNVRDAIAEISGGGIDEVISSVSFALRSNFEILTLTGNAVRASGNNMYNRLNGNDANNVINGGLGGDIMRGGGGNDIYYVEDNSDHTIETAGAGRDRVYTTISWQLENHVEDLFARGSATINLTGNNLDNAIVGNAANNIIDGRAGADDLRGARGADTFVFRNGEFGGLTASTADRILDFRRAEGDRIDLQQVDAHRGIDGDQSFTFIGTAEFSGVAGQLRYQITNGNTYVYGDANGDGVADFLIRLDGSLNLAGGDFIL